MNNSYTNKTVHQLPSTFTAQLYSVLLAVKRMHDWGDGCEIKVGFHKTDIALSWISFLAYYLSSVYGGASQQSHELHS